MRSSTRTPLSPSKYTPGSMLHNIPGSRSIVPLGGGEFLVRGEADAVSHSVVDILLQPEVDVKCHIKRRELLVFDHWSNATAVFR